jgi:hypothetical protein
MYMYVLGLGVSEKKGDGILMIREKQKLDKIFLDDRVEE